MFALFVAVAVVVGITIGRWSWRRNRRSITLGFGLLGLATGMILGLSNSPVIGGAITAGFTFAGSLIAHFFPPITRSQDDAEAAAPAVIDVTSWLPPFAGTLVVGILLGIVLRVNELLLFRTKSLRQTLLDDGFTTVQVDLIMERYSKEVRHEAYAAGAKPVVGLISAESKATLRELLEQAQKSNMDSNKTLEFIRQVAPQPILDEIAAIEREKSPLDSEGLLRELKFRVWGTGKE